MTTTPRRYTSSVWHLRTALMALVLVSTPLRALADPTEDLMDPRYVQENFFKFKEAVGPPRCKGEWCVATVKEGYISGMPRYDLFLRDPKGNVTELSSSRAGELPYFVLDEQGHVKVDNSSSPWTSSEEEAPQGQLFEPSEEALRAALAACRKASASCAERLVTTKGTCNRRGCVLSVSSKDEAPFCFMWQAAGSNTMDLLGMYSEPLGYSGPSAWLNTRAVGVGGLGCNGGCEMRITALVRDRLRRIAQPGEIPQSSLSWADTSLIPPVDAVRLRQVTYGIFSWDGPLDAAARWQLALLPHHLQVKATIVDDVLELEPCVGGKRPAVSCDHLELVAEDGPARGAMVSVLLLPDGAARVERWREPGGKDLRQPLAGGRCSWTRLEPRKARDAANELEVRCELPQEALWREGSTRSLSLRYSDAEEGKQQSLVSVTQKFLASTQYPAPFVPEVQRCTPDR
jgi:hypothetical protein